MEIKNGNSYNNQKINVRLFIPRSFVSTSKTFHPFLEDGTRDKRLNLDFKSGKICTIEIDSYIQYYGWQCGRLSGEFTEHSKFTPSVKIKKGTQKPADPRTKKAFLQDCTKLVEEISKEILGAEDYFSQQNKINQTPFVPEPKQRIVTDSIQKHIADLKNNKLNAEHLLSKVNSYASTK